MKVLLVGDVHANVVWWKTNIEAWAEDLEVDLIFQVGDLGWWPHQRFGESFLNAVAAFIERTGIRVEFIDGNHENFDDLWAPETTLSVDPDRKAEVLPGLFYVPRGTRWEWEGVSFLGLGGAPSIDQEYRIIGSSWWPQEVIREADMWKAIEQAPVDVMITHDAPRYLKWDRPFDSKYDSLCRSNRDAVHAVVEAHRPDVLIHGHYHESYVSRLHLDGKDVKIYGLGCDHMDGSVLLMNVEGGSISVGSPSTRQHVIK